MASPITNASSTRAAGAWIEGDGLYVHFGTHMAIENVTVRLGPGETVSLVGPNGAGKSTLLKTLAGMVSPSHGRVRLNGSPIRTPPRRVVYVPQRSGVDWTFPVSVLDVALMGAARHPSRLIPFGRKTRAAALEALEQVGMDRLAKVQIGQLSGGQQQRVFLARALLQEGDIYLLDEPFGGVDVPTQELLVENFERLRAEGKTIAYATHDLAQVARYAGRVVLLNRTLLADGSPADVMTASNLRATFGGGVVVGGGDEATVVVGFGSRA